MTIPRRRAACCRLIHLILHAFALFVRGRPQRFSFTVEFSNSTRAALLPASARISSSSSSTMRIIRGILCVSIKRGGGMKGGNKRDERLNHSRVRSFYLTVAFVTVEHGGLFNRDSIINDSQIVALSAREKLLFSLNYPYPFYCIHY